MRSIKELECSDSDFTGSVNFSFCAQGRFGGRMREKFMSRRLMLALLVEKKKSRNEPGADSHGRMKLKSFEDKNNTCVSDLGTEREPKEEVKGTDCNVTDLSRRTILNNFKGIVSLWEKQRGDTVASCKKARLRQ